MCWVRTCARTCIECMECEGVPCMECVCGLSIHSFSSQELLALQKVTYGAAMQIHLTDVIVNVAKAIMGQ